MTVTVNGISQTRNCDRADIILDNATHELGHLLGLQDQMTSNCNTFAMGQTAFTPAGAYIDRTLHSSECAMVRDTNHTPQEQIGDLCADDPTLPQCGSGGGGSLQCLNYACHSPIVLDLDGDGFLLSGADDPVGFDIDGDGELESLAWTARGERDAFLALDRNGNGRIDDGSELFGDSTPLLNGTLAPNGYNVLFELDVVLGDGNGYIDPWDEVYPYLRLWIDRNHNGRSEPGELHTLAQARIAAIAVEFLVSFAEDPHGNQLRYQGEAWRWRGGELQPLSTVDVFFRLNE